jgi:hypothetical protein
MYIVGVWWYRETEWLSCCASYCTSHLLYKYCTNCTVYNWTVLTVITHKLLLHVQLHNNPQTPQLISSAVQYIILLQIIHISVRVVSVMSFDRAFQIHATATKHSVTSSQHHETHPTAPLFGIVCVCRQRSLDTSNSHYWLQVWRDSGLEQADVTEITGTLCKLRVTINICCMKRKWVWIFSEIYRQLQNLTDSVARSSLPLIAVIFDGSDLCFILCI